MWSKSGKEMAPVQLPARGYHITANGALVEFSLWLFAYFLYRVVRLRPRWNPWHKVIDDRRWIAAEYTAPESIPPTRFVALRQ